MNATNVMPASSVSDENAAAKKAAGFDSGTIGAGAFLTGISALLRESVQRFEAISGGVTEAVMSRPGIADRDLIVTLQAFDRLQQEFVAVADVLARYSGSLADSASRHESPARVEEEVIAAIAMSDLKERLLQHLRNRPGAPSETPPPGEEVF